MCPVCTKAKRVYHLESFHTGWLPKSDSSLAYCGESPQGAGRRPPFICGTSWNGLPALFRNGLRRLEAPIFFKYNQWFQTLRSHSFANHEMESWSYFPPMNSWVPFYFKKWQIYRSGERTALPPRSLFADRRPAPRTRLSLHLRGGEHRGDVSESKVWSLCRRGSEKLRIFSGLNFCWAHHSNPTNKSKLLQN